jgi:hypothetical protein
MAHPGIDINDVRLLKGYQRSQQTLFDLSLRRAVERVRVSGPVPISDLSWQRAQGYAIRRDVAGQVWHAGHVSAVLSTGSAAIIGTQTGGCYLINPAYGAMPVDSSHPATSLSQEWNDVSVTCLAYGPDGETGFFAGCGEGVLYYVELKIVLGGLEFVKATGIPLAFLSGSVHAIAVLPVSRRIVVACDTGAWWSPIPASPSQATQYSWTQGRGLPAGTAVSGIAIGPTETVVAAMWGSNAVDSAHGMYRGTWMAGSVPSLNFAASTVTGVAVAAMRRTSVASCEKDRAVMYAIAAASDEAVAAIIRSGDGGSTWAAVTTPDWTQTGYQGFYNNCIAVSPFRSSLVAFGWRSGGPFISRDGGAVWEHPLTDASDSNLHGDLHVVYFPHNVEKNEGQLFVGGDGGLVMTRDYGASYDSEYNKHLGNLQFYNEVTGGRFVASQRFPGLVAGGTQDNGNVYCDLNDERKYWRALDDGCDGGNVQFLDDVASVVRTTNTQPAIHISSWNGATRRFVSAATGYGDVVPVDGTASGLQTSVFAHVVAPSWSRNEELMYACAALGNDVYGLFAKSDGTGAHLTKLATVANPVGTLASYDGSSVLAGTNPAGILRIDSATGTITTQTIPSGLTGPNTGIRRLQVTPDRAFALHSDLTLLRWTGTDWMSVSSGHLTFALHPNPGSRRVFAASVSRVDTSEDDGVTWASASVGLPRSPNCADMAVAPDGAGGHVLYLATYGRSVWQAQVDYSPSKEPPHIPELVGEILFGIIGDGGGLIRIGPRIVRVPPRQPVTAILDGIARYRMAQTLDEGPQRSAQIDALRAIQRVAAQEIARLEG